MASETSVFVNSFLALICFLAGSISFLNGYSLLFDDRELNRQLPSSLLMLAGINIISEGFFILGFRGFKYIQVIVLVFQITVGVISTLLIREYRKKRDKKIQERTKPKESHYDKL